MTNGVQVGSLASLDGKGKAGDVRVHSSDSIKLLGGSAIASQALRGDGGNLEIITNELIAKDASQIGTSTFGQGNSGDLFVKARLIKLIGTDGTSNIFPSGFFSAVNIDEDNPNNRAGNGGQLTIETDKLLLSDGAQILTSARSTGNAGDLTINAADSITIRGTDPKATLIKGQSAILAAIEPAAKINEQVVISTGESGSIDITTDRLIIEDGGKISADTFGPNNAGNINLNINNLIIQKGGLVQAGSLIESPEENVNLLPDGSPNLERGKGGNITINAASSVEITGRGTVGDGAKKIPVNSQILVAAEGTGEAGNLTINTGNLTVKSGGEINGRTASGTGGNIDLNVSDIILLKNSPIIATADNNGDGGNITINTDFLIAEDGGRINADAKEGTGGNINITAESVFLDAPIDERITASSERGIDGVVEINTPDIDPTKGLLQFSSDVVDAADLIARNVCEKGRDSKYIVTGKGGIPSNPNELLDTDNDVVEVNLIEPLPVNESESSPKPRSQNNQVKSRVIPARGWIFNDRGEGVLVGYDPTLASPQREDKPRVCDRDE
jgi:large exoprotein involved in heme utilization and adhesion